MFGLVNAEENMYLPTSDYTSREDSLKENDLRSIPGIPSSQNIIRKDEMDNRSRIAHVLSPAPPINSRISTITDLKPPASVLLPHINEEVRHYNPEGNSNILNQYHYQYQRTPHLQPYHTLNRHHDIHPVNDHQFHLQQILAINSGTTNISNSPPLSNILHPSIESTKVAIQVPLHYHLHKINPEDSEPSVASIPQINCQSLKKKRGRPKKLIFDPTTNEYIDSSHPNYKHLNKTLKESIPNNTSSTVNPKTQGAKDDSVLSKFYDKPTYMRKLEDDAVQELLLKKDKRGRPRKFPIEQTGLTIKGIRVNGVSKHKKKPLKL